MPLSNYFRKFNKRESQSVSSRKSKNDVFGDPSLQKNRVSAAQDVMRLFDLHFKPTEKSVHVQTVLYTAACLAGTSLFRSFGYSQNTETGTVVLSDKANQEGQNLLNLFMFFIQNYGVKLKPSQLETNFTDGDKPHFTILEIQDSFQDNYQAIMEKHGLSFVDGARAGIVVCSMLFGHHCAHMKDVNINLGAGIIAMGLVEGAKSTPLPLDPNKATMKWGDAT